MTADEIETFLKTDDSTGAGWGKEDGSGESVGHESGRKIVDILKRNPDKVCLCISLAVLLTVVTNPDDRQQVSAERGGALVSVHEEESPCEAA